MFKTFCVTTCGRVLTVDTTSGDGLAPVCLLCQFTFRQTKIGGFENIAAPS